MQATPSVGFRLSGAIPVPHAAWQGLHADVPVFRELLERCLELLEPHVEGDVTFVGVGKDQEDADAAHRRLEEQWEREWQVAANDACDPDGLFS